MDGLLLDFTDSVVVRFVERPNRFLIVAEDPTGQRVNVSCQDPGRMRELLLPGVEMRVRPSRGAGRKTAFTAVLVRHGVHWVGLVPALANALAAAAVTRGLVEGFEGATVIGREVKRGSSRFDLLLGHQDRRWLVEVKSVSLIEDGIAYFPDAPTERGARHVEELSELAAAGEPTAVFFVVQRPDATELRPNPRTDPRFVEAIARACRSGVLFAAFGCRLDPTGVAFVGAVPFRPR